jgi:2-polyprenyl-3-methyl-5-hydroxy-6-metoxy-1,4-benzoquinol methylase
LEDLIKRDCEVCGPTNSIELLKVRGSAYHECANCGLIFARWISANYENTNEIAFAAELTDYASKAKDQRRAKKLRRQLKTYQSYHQTGNFLELGCNAGAVLLTARELGWQVHGVDISKAATEFGRNQWNLNLHTGTIDTAAYADNYFDVIYSNAVLEHVEAPLVTLKEIQRVLRPGGIFYCNTVNWASYTREILNEHWLLIDPTHHIHLYTPDNVNMLCERAGLQHLRTWTTGARVQANTPGSSFKTPFYLNLMKGPLSALTRLTRKGDSIHFTATKASA